MRSTALEQLLILSQTPVGGMYSVWSYVHESKKNKNSVVFVSLVILHAIHAVLSFYKNV